MRFRLLGPVEVHDDGVPVGPNATKLRTVLAVLLLARSKVVSNARLTTMLWGDQRTAASAAQIQTYMSRLRRLVGPDAELVRQHPGYLLRVPPEEIDLFEFERLAADGRQSLAAGQFAQAADELRRALALWRGPALSGVTDFLGDAERPRLEEARLAVWEDRVQADLNLGAHAGVVSELTGFVAAHPLRERQRAQLMLALHGSGRQAEALTTYDDYRRLLADEVGIDPGADLQELHNRILTARQASPAVRATIAIGAPPAQLPADIADFTGRAREVDLVVGAMRRHGSVCVLSGMAGVGKSALAVHAAHQCRSDYPDGQLHVDLGGSGRPVDPAEALAVMLTALWGTAVPDTLEDRIRLYRSRIVGKRVLILLDDAVSESQVRPLLPGGPGSTVVVTARRRLVALEGAALVDLPLPSPHESLGLLHAIVGVDRFRAEPGAAQRIVELCGHLPLAVRIAGARLAAKPHWTLSRLAGLLTDRRGRLDELRVADLDVRARLISGYRGLDEQARHAFRLLSLPDVPHFPSRAAALLLDLTSAEADEVLERLVDARLLDVVVIRGDARLHYRFPELARCLALELAGPEEQLGRHRAALRRLSDMWPEPRFA
ncbi:BTAD domain-containing putative transcriptional regulator [Actinosynnema sp. NPDC047251]|uniref:Regulatory protein AfsR n=1 Tax=Saccharothrix espanaensis (strain ATCC 51144 / DSM 44229 / JCM 9112 / NBRC 15066 / NRRL 15764) TaxID=1179773 RepID=K0JYX8_SACES|nr:AfsR/SARP family transcriptional regulator [Saccharothrix espanaensis]CCH29463.1 Regulatory protein AfsR [Saccharothrix espanaensis DSM 44229]